MLHRFAHSGERAAGAVTGDERINRPRKSIEDFRSGGVLVVVRVNGIFKLAGQNAAAPRGCCR
jgi:hypothetical protein